MPIVHFPRIKENFYGIFIINKVSKFNDRLDF